ncbi:MAG TPA: GNAT family N-acetyltransferase [Candidatus Angelobacter sp.]|nr:GNAT family N-acetyltransferase [Candidatus Angelobacter sp.]
MSTAVNRAIRDGQPGDAAIIAELASRTFRQTYGPQTRADDMEAFLADAYLPENIDEQLANRRHRFLLATSDETVVGFAHLTIGEGYPPVVGRLPVLLAEIYLDQEHKGVGLGAALMRRALEIARDAGADVLWLGVWEHNAPAIEFYRRWGFTAVGSMPFTFGSEEHRDIVMALPLTDT